MLVPTNEALIAAGHQRSEPNRVGVLAGELIRAAAQLTVSGEEKHQQVVDALRNALFMAGASPDELRKWVTEALGIGGFAGRALRGLLRIVPIGKVIDGILGYAVQTAYRAMKRAGIAL